MTKCVTLLGLFVEFQGNLYAVLKKFLLIPIFRATGHLHLSLTLVLNIAPSVEVIWQGVGSGELQQWPLWGKMWGCPMPGTATSSWLQNGPISDQSWAHRQCWWHLCGKILKKAWSMSFIVLFFPILLRRGSEIAAGWAIGSQPKLT